MIKPHFLTPHPLIYSQYHRLDTFIKNPLNPNIIKYTTETLTQYQKLSIFKLSTPLPHNNHDVHLIRKIRSHLPSLLRFSPFCLPRPNTLPYQHTILKEHLVIIYSPFQKSSPSLSLFISSQFVVYIQINNLNTPHTHTHSNSFLKTL